MVSVTAPTPEEYLALAAEHQHRYPEKTAITVVGDKGESVRLPFVIGTPSGACVLPPGVKPSPIWDLYVSAVLLKTPMPDDAVTQAASDCILFPDAATWKMLATRWPALAGRVWDTVKKKCAADYAIADEPSFDESLPSPVVEASAKYPQASLRRFSPTLNKNTYKFLMVIDPPQSIAWRLFIKSLGDKSTEPRKLVADMARASVKLVYDEDKNEAVAIDDAMLMFPGLSLLSCLTISVLAGAAAEVERGEF